MCRPLRSNSVDDGMNGNSSLQVRDPRSASGIFERHGSLTRRFWKFDLCDHMPRKLTSDGVCAERGEPQRVRAFLKDEFPVLTEEAVAPIANADAALAKREYIETACDLVELRHEEKTVGVLVGAPEDWSSYYIRIFAVAQRYQRPTLIRRFGAECIFEPLRAHHVQRVVADTSPCNLAMSRTLSELRFYATGHQLTDRWGPLVRYTKFLDPACEDAFLRRFNGIAPPGSQGRRKE